MTKHKPACAKAMAERDQAREAWRQQWPSHCPDCEGWGGATFKYDVGPAGVSLSPPTVEEFDPCGECVGHGECPRCATDAWDSYDYEPGELTCPECGFVVGKEQGMPTVLPCSCWEDEA